MNDCDRKMEMLRPLFDEHEEIVAKSDGRLLLLRETPGERACSVLAAGIRFWPSRVKKIIFTSDPSAPVMGADEKL